MTRNVRRGTVRDVKAGGTTRQKLREWVRRYLPCEIAGTVGELGGAAVAYLATGSLAAAAIAATIGASAGYYAAAYVSAVRWSYRDHGHRRWPSRVLVSNLLALRSVAVEFGPAELIDSVAIRPVAFYVGPLIFGNTIARLDLRQARLRPRVLLSRDLQLRAIQGPAGAGRAER